MNETLDAVVVGVDGSPAARAAVSWAVAEARDRGVPLRLVTVIADDRACGDRARDALRLARAAVEDQSPIVAFEEVIRHGEVARELLEESRSAALICVGTRHRMGAPLGVIAATLAERAQCAVAVICAADVDHDGVIAVVLDDEPDNDAVVLQAMKEGRLRHATVRQIDRRLTRPGCAASPTCTSKPSPRERAWGSASRTVGACPNWRCWAARTRCALPVWSRRTAIPSSAIPIARCYSCMTASVGSR